MANGFPVWRMGQMQRRQTDAAQSSRQPAPAPPPAPPPPTAPAHEKPPHHGTESKQNALPFLPEGLRLDRDTLLLLGLAWLLWQEKADKRLLLALLYILM